MFRAAAFAAAVALAPAALPAQQHPLVGVWKINYPAGMRIENGVRTPIFLTATLTVEARSDSLVGMLVTDPPADLPPRPDVRLATKTGPGEVTFVQRSKATINTNGSEQQATSVANWTLVAKGDSLEGTIDRKLEGVDLPSAGPQPVTGTRVKN